MYDFDLSPLKIPTTFGYGLFHNSQGRYCFFLYILVIIHKHNTLITLDWNLLRYSNASFSIVVELRLSIFSYSHFPWARFLQQLVLNLFEPISHGNYLKSGQQDEANYWSDSDIGTPSIPFYYRLYIDIITKV